MLCYVHYLKSPVCNFDLYATWLSGQLCCSVYDLGLINSQFDGLFVTYCILPAFELLTLCVVFSHLILLCAVWCETCWLVEGLAAVQVIDLRGFPCT
jgi:hypothetical protein